MVILRTRCCSDGFFFFASIAADGDESLVAVVVVVVDVIAVVVVEVWSFRREGKALVAEVGSCGIKGDITDERFEGKGFVE